MYLLDTDHIGFLQRPKSPEFGRLVQRMSLHPATAFFWPIISFHEQVLGANAYIHQARSIANLCRGYEILEEVRQYFPSIPVIPFNLPAAKRFEQLRQQKVRIGTMDLRIAAMALEKNFTVLTRNLNDFRQVPSLQFADWTV
jgi:tRNA(fMet)-specific endonuclease VapC